MQPGIAIAGLWIGWGVSWAIAAFWSNRTEARPGIGTELRFRFRIPMAIGALLMLVPAWMDLQPRAAVATSRSLNRT